MSKNFYPLFLSLFFFSCSNYLPYSETGRAKSITDIPLKASTGNIDCFFSNQLPAKPFYRIKITEITGDANASYDELIISLKNKAAQEGLDGLLILDKKQETSYENLNQKIEVKDTSVSYYTQMAKPYQKLTAIGIKYVENINYLDTIVKSTSFKFDNTEGVMNFDFYGNVANGTDAAFNRYYADSIEPFEIGKHLLRAVKGWQYKTVDVYSNEVTAFRKQAGDLVKIDIKRDYKDVNKFTCNFLNRAGASPSGYVLRLEKNTNGKITRETLYKKNTVVWVEEIYYAKNTITGYKRYRVDDGKEVIIFNASNQFFSVNDLPEN